MLNYPVFSLFSQETVKNTVKTLASMFALYLQMTGYIFSLSFTIRMDAESKKSKLIR